MKHVIFSVVCALAAGTATVSYAMTPAQTDDADVSATTATSTQASGAGHDTLTEAQVNRNLKNRGYTDIKVSSGSDGNWSGTAVTNGVRHKVVIDSQGRVSRQ